MLEFSEQLSLFTKEEIKEWMDLVVSNKLMDKKNPAFWKLLGTWCHVMEKEAERLEKKRA